MNKKIMSAAALLLCGALALGGCGSKPSEDLAMTGKANSYDDTIVATIDGENIYLSDFNFAYYSNAARYEQYCAYMGIEDWESYELEGQTCGEYVRESSVSEIKQLIITQKKAKEYGIEVNQDMLDTAEEQKSSVIEESFGGDEGYQEYLDEYYTSDAAVGRYLLRASILNSLFEQLSADGGECAVADDEIDYNDDTYLKVKHVLIQTSDDVSDEAALAKANEVIAKLNAGEDMAKLVEEYGEDPGMENSEYYVFTEGEMVDEFYQASKELEIGKYTQAPVKSSYGYHVIYRYALDDSDEKFTELKTSKQQEKFMDLLEGWVEEVESTVDDKAIDVALADQKEKTAAKQAEEAAENEAGNADDEASDEATNYYYDDDAVADSGEEIPLDDAEE